MNKSSLFIAAGAAVILCGCSTTPVAGNKPVIPAPVEDPQPIETPATIAADDTKLAPATRQSQVPVFEPLTGVTSSGGVDSAPRGRKSVKSAKAGKVVAAGGTYIVKSGDTPERIARRHGVRLSALMAANNLTPQSARRLQIGQKLTIPGRNAKAAVSGTKKAAKKSARAVAPVATADADGKYVVKPGDSPERIARKLRVRLSDLLKANNLDQQSARRLQIGQKLTIPGKDAKVAPAKKSGKVKKSAAAKNTTTPAVDAEGKYTVQSGDSLFLIAKAFGTTVQQIKELNGMKNDRIRVGQKLNVPKE